MKETTSASKVTIDRLPVYFRELKRIFGEGYDIISSEKLGFRIGFSPEQIRKDLATFGEFGKRGIGYSVKDLMRVIGEILGLDKRWNIAILGAGHLGQALANNRKLASIDFNLEAIFDNDPLLIGKAINGIEISDGKDLEQLITARNIHIVVIATPAYVAQELAAKAVAAGVRGIWNFAPVSLDVPVNVSVVNADLSIGLATLYYYVSNTKQDIAANY